MQTGHGLLSYERAALSSLEPLISCTSAHVDSADTLKILMAVCERKADSAVLETLSHAAGATQRNFVLPACKRKLCLHHCKAFLSMFPIENEQTVKLTSRIRLQVTMQNCASRGIWPLAWRSCAWSCCRGRKRGK